MRIGLALLVVVSFATPAAAAPKLLVLRADSSADWETRTHVEAVVMGLARNVDRGAGQSETSFKQVADMIGCTKDFAGCKTDVIDTLAIDEIVVIGIAAAEDKITVRVRRASKANTREATAVVTKDDDAGIVAAIGPLFGATKMIGGPAKKPAKAPPKGNVSVGSGGVVDNEQPPDRKPNTSTSTARSDGSKPDGSRPDGSKPDGSKPDGSKPDGSRPDGSRPDDTRPIGSRSDGSRISRPDDTRPVGSRPDESRPGGSRISRPDDTRPVGSRPEGITRPEGVSRPEGSRPEGAKVPFEVASAPPSPEVSAAPDNRIDDNRVDAPTGKRSRAGIAMMAGGGALAVVGIVLWRRAASTEDEIRAAPNRTPADVDHLLDLEDRGDRYALWGNITFFGGLAVAGVGGYLFWRSGGGSSATTARVTPVVLDHGVAFTLEVR